jgi:hypothetical protein
MRDVLGLRIGLVTFDQFQSMASRQYLEEIGIPVAYQSVDKTDEQHLFFVDCMYKNCVHFSKEFADMIQKELFNLIWYRNKRKVDHPSDTAHGGTKDVMDGVVGALYNAKTSKEAVYDPSDILNLTQYNSDSVYDYNDEPDFNGIKQISLDKLDDVYTLKAKQTGIQ